MVDHVEDLGLSLLSILECPICVDYMQLPIFQCSSGHSMCSNCIAKLDECPVCKSSVKELVRNYSLEKLSEQLIIDCPNMTNGCPSKLERKSSNAHKQTCPYTAYQCPWAQDPSVDCSWIGLRKDRVDHFKDAHKDLVLDAQSSHMSFYYDFNKDYVHGVEMLQLRNNIFVAYDHYDKQTSKCSKVVQYLGPCEDAAKFEYKVEFYSKDNYRRLTYCRRVHSEDEDVHALIETDDCFTMTEQQVKQYLIPNQEGLLFSRWNVRQVQ